MVTLYRQQLLPNDVQAHYPQRTLAAALLLLV